MKLPVQDKKLTQWIISNLIGIYSALLVGPVLFLIISENFFPSYLRSTYPYYATNYEILASVLNWFPLGLAFGVAQQIGLSQWNIHLKQWAIVTAICSCLPLFLFTVGMPHLRWLFLGNPLISKRIEMINDIRYWITFICVVAVQAFMLRNSVSRSWRWVYVYISTVIVLFVALALTGGVAFIIAKPLLKFLYSYKFYDIIAYRWVLYSLTLMFILPIPTVFTFSYLTARILHSAGVIEKTNTG